MRSFLGVRSKAKTAFSVETMSYSVHRRLVADTTLPLEQRARHARSCALHVANKLAVKRSVVLEYVKQQTGVDLVMPGADEALVVALASLEALRSGAQKLGLPAG